MKFSDLHLRAPIKDVDQTRKLILKSSELGFSQIGVPLPPNVEPDLIGKLRQISEDAGIDFVTRLDLAPRSSGELLRSLRKLRPRFETVSVLCSSKPVARQAAKDRRVDLLSFPARESRKRFFDRAEAELASKSSVGFEIDMAQVLALEGFARASFLSCLRREVLTAKKFGVPIVVSSGANHVSFLRKPQDCASLTFLFDMDVSVALDAMSKNASVIVERNRSKQSPDYVGPGIRIVRRRRSC